MTKKLIYVALLGAVIIGSAVATWSFSTEVAEVTLTIDKPVKIQKLELAENITIVGGTFAVSGSTQLYAEENSRLSMMQVAGLSKEEKKQFEELSLEAVISGDAKTVDLLQQDQWAVDANLGKGESATIEIALIGELADDVEKDSIKFDILAMFVGREV